MPKFALKYPFFIIMLCLVSLLLGAVSIGRMPVDLFPPIDLPVVVVATFYSGMPPQQIEADITDTFERFFTLGSNIDHIESRSLTGVSLIKVYFRAGTDPNAALSNIANLAMADLRRLPPGTLPPVVLSMDASNQPVCLVTLKGQGLNETSLKDLAQFQVRNQIANVQGASVPQPFGGTYRQIQVYVDPLKLEAHNLSLMDVVHAVNSSNLILPAGDVRIGTKDFNIYANAQFPVVKEINSLPIKTVGNASILVADVGRAEDAGALQTNIVRIDGQRSVYIPVLKQGGGSNTITIVNGIKAAIKHLVDIPASLQTAVVFDQSVFVKLALKELLNELIIGLALTGLMILLFLGERARHHRGDASGAVVGDGLYAHCRCHGRLHQHHVAGWYCLGVLPADRQRRGGSGKHLPLHGDGGTDPGSVGKGRDGSFSGRPRSHGYDVDRFLARGVSYRREQISLHSARAWRGYFHLCLLCLCHDRHPSVLRHLSRRASRIRHGKEEVVLSADSGKVQHLLSTHAGLVCRYRQALHGASRFHCNRLSLLVSCW